MEDIVALKMLVNKAVADEVTKKGLAEIALRRADAKFKAFFKCPLLGENVLSEGVPQRLASSAMKLSILNVKSMDSIRKSLRTFEKGIGNQVTALTTATKNIALQVDSIYSLTSSVRSLTYLNTGISLANLAVNVAGFITVNNKLNLLNLEVQRISVEIRKIANAQKNEMIADCQKMIMQFNSMSGEIQNNELRNLRDLEKLIIDMRAFLLKIILNLHDEVLEIELALNIVFLLLQPYTLLLCEYTKRWYYEEQSLPPNYETFLSLYDELMTVDIRKKIHDYYFIDQKMHSQEVIDILNAQTLIGLNGRVQIEDQVSILKMLGTRAKAEAFDRDLDDFVHSWLKEKVPVIAENSGMSEKECLKVIDEGFSPKGILGNIKKRLIGCITLNSRVDC